MTKLRLFGRLKLKHLYRKASLQNGLCVIIIIVIIIVLARGSLNQKYTPFNSDASRLALKENIPEINSRYITNKTIPIQLLCYVLLSRSKVRVAKIIKETWGSHCDQFLFFGGYEFPELGVTYLNITESYEKLWGKAKAAVLYLATHPIYKKFEYFMKADDDTFVIIENLREFIKQNAPLLKEPTWFGFKLKHSKTPQGYMSGGAGYVFNKGALERIAKTFTQTYRERDSSIDCNVNGIYGIEDLEIGKCFHSAGVKSIDTFDKDGKEAFLPISYEAFLSGTISSFHWIWKQAWNRVKPGEKCCSQNLISMHEVSPTQMKTIYNLLYKIKVAGSRSEDSHEMINMIRRKLIIECANSAGVAGVPPLIGVKMTKHEEANFGKIKKL